MSALVALAATVVTVLQLLLLARVVSSWVLVLAGAGAPHRGLVGVDTALARLTEPVLAPVRRVIPPLRLGSVALDLSIPVVLLALSVLTVLLPGV